MKTEKFDGRLTAPLSEFLSQKVAQGVERGRRPEGRRDSLPVSALDAADVLADHAAQADPNQFAAHAEGYC
jgi:hypothetical protein